MSKPGISGIVHRTVFLLGLLVAAASAQATVIASYPFTGASLASTDAESASTASAITLGSGLTDSVATRFAAANGNPAPALRVNSDETEGTTFATAITANDFFAFTLAPGTGNRFFFQTLTFDLAASAATLATNVRLQASINGSAFVTVDSVTTFSTTAYTTETFDLSFGNTNAALAAGASVLLRMVVFDDANSATVYTGFDNLTVNGTVAAIPEPGTAGMLAVGVLAAGGAVWHRRRSG